MIYTATVTSQGQITIPVQVRRILGLTPAKKTIITVEQDKMILEPEPDIMKLAGALHKYAMKNKPIGEIIKIEEEAVEEAVAQRYRNKMRKMGITVPK